MNPTRLMFALLAIAMVTAALPLVAAQNTPASQSTLPPSIVLTITPPDSPIKPLSGVRTINVGGTFTATAGVSVTQVQINYKIDSSPPWAAVSVSPSTVFANVLGSPGQSVTVQIPTTILVSTTADAPAFTPAEIKLTATSLPSGDIAGATTTETTLVEADFFSIIDAAAATTIQIARPQTQVAYPITVTNFGNADTKVFFEIASKPEGWQVQEPIPITLEAKQQGGKQTTQTVNLNILTPYHNGYLNEVGAITMKITSNYALDSKQKGDTTQVSVLTTVKGFYVPGPGSMLVVLAIAGLAMLVGRARRS